MALMLGHEWQHIYNTHLPYPACLVFLCDSSPDFGIIHLIKAPMQVLLLVINQPMQVFLLVISQHFADVTQWLLMI
jgi:hypothetical protein